MNAIIIGIHGKMRSGKSVICEAMPDMLRWPTNNELIIAYSSLSMPIKQMVSDEYNIQMSEEIKWTMKYDICNMSHDFSNHDKSKLAYKSSTVGQLLQATGARMRETLGEDYLVKESLKIYTTIPSDIIILDGIRHKSDADYVKSLGGKVISVVRDTHDESNGRDETHLSETELDGYKFDMVIENRNMVTRKMAVYRTFDTYHDKIKSLIYG